MMEDEGEKEQVWWSWGAGTEGQLGTGRLEDQHFPQLLPSLSSSPPISLLSCGGAHVIALTTCGKVLTWGRGTCGQLGHGDLVNSLEPKALKNFENTVITHVSAGWNHSGFVSDTGCLFTSGDGSFGQLGHGDYTSHSFPVQVSYFASNHVEQIACGTRHSLVLLKGQSKDQVYGFGSGKRGQLGISKDKIGSINVPQVTLGLDHVKITSIYANGDHSAALSADRNLYIWGRGFSGTSNAYYPQCLISSLSFVQAALGWNHALGLTGDGEVHMLGGYRPGMLSESQKMSPEDSKEPIMERISGIDGIKVLEIAAGAEHSALITESGLTMTWGWGEHGQLGLGDTSDQISPQMVRLGDILANRCSTFKVYCGSGFTFAVREDRLPSRS